MLQRLTDNRPAEFTLFDAGLTYFCHQICNKVDNAADPLPEGIVMALKEKILQLLEANKGKSISGNKIATQMNVSRSAVWKAVNLLREEGYSINGGTNRGYCLTSDNDKLSEPAIQNMLKTKYIGKSIDMFKTIDSTNTFAKSLAQLGAESGHVVAAEHQTEGRGRMGRQFFSPNYQGIYMSVIIRPNIPIEQAMGITACAAVAVCDAIEESIADIESPGKREGNADHCMIKWVNDIYLNDRKVCGILTEASVGIEQGGLDYVVLGFGINVNNYNFPDELRNTATSIRLECGESVSRTKLAASLLNHLEQRLEELGKSSLMDEYRRRLVLSGRIIDVENNGITERFECLGVDDIGRLLVKRGNGQELALTSGTVTVLS